MGKRLEEEKLLAVAQIVSDALVKHQKTADTSLQH